MGVLVADTVAGLGVPDEDGAHGLIRTAHAEEPLTWNKAQQVWVGQPRVSMRMNENLGISTQGLVAFWKYPGNFPEVPRPVVNPVAHNFRIHKVLYGGELWAAGLRLQENLSAEIKQIADEGVDDSSIALAWYPLDEGDAFLSPISFNHGVRCVLDKDEQQINAIHRWCASGWQNNTTIEADTPPTATQHLYPEIYTYGPSISFRHFTALHRWVGGPGRGPGGSFQDPSKYPPGTWVVGWYRAEHVGAPDNQAVAELADFSGRGQALRQPTVAKRPTVMRDGSLGNARFLRFDGTNDVLSTVASPIPLAGPETGPNSPLSLTAPTTVYLVMRQRNAGGAQQVWLGTGGTGAPLLYRGDATDQVNLWYGGSDVVYHRAQPWSTPMPWTILSVMADADSLSAWENLTEAVAGAAAGAGFAGLALGNNSAETLPAAIDVAELIVCNDAHTDPQRTTMVNYLNARYGVF